MSALHDDIPTPDEEELAILRQDPAEYRRFAVMYAYQNGLSSTIRDLGCTEAQIHRWMEGHSTGRGQKRSRVARKPSSPVEHKAGADSEDLLTELCESLGMLSIDERQQDPSKCLRKYFELLKRDRGGRGGLA